MNIGITPLKSMMPLEAVHFVNKFLTHKQGLRSRQDHHHQREIEQPMIFSIATEMKPPHRLTFHIKSCDPVPTDSLHPSIGVRLCERSCSPINQSMRRGRPAVGPYCNPLARSGPERETVETSSGLDGHVAVNEKDLKGNMALFGFPARKEITPGLLSNG